MIPDEGPRDPYAARPIDLPTPVPLAPDADLSTLDEAKILAAPDEVADRPAWRGALHRWRREARRRTGFDAALYDNAETAWAATAWNVAMVWLWDEALRDWDHERFDAERLLAQYDDFGGLDAVVLWHAYPVIGIDPRNQFDWYDVPGLSELVTDLQWRGVRVFLDYNPWDVGTRRTGRSDADCLSDAVSRLGADGVFLDTLKEGDPELLASLATLRPRPVLEGESRVPLARIVDHQASWAQWFEDSRTPGILRARWFEQRHMMHHTRRWNRDHSAELRSAWVNGAGVLIWDVVFGVRVDWTPRDRAALRAMRRVYRHLEDHLVRGAWEPLTQLHPDATAAGIAGSCWRLDGHELYTLANPTSTTYNGPLVVADVGEDVVTVLGDGTVPAGGIAGLLRIPAQATPPVGLPALLVELVADNEPEPESAPSTPVRVKVMPAPDLSPQGAVHVTAGERILPVRWRQRETGLYEDAPYVDDWKPLPPRLHQLREGKRAARVGTAAASTVAIDAAEVTNADFARFLSSNQYAPTLEHRFLAHWVDGAPAVGTGDDPVCFVDLTDARAYARWRGARLPSEDEWQAAATEPGWRRHRRPVWEWTESEHRDGRTRWVILKGGSWYSAEGSEWYIDGGPKQPDWSLRFLLTQAGTGRSECIGFRCAVDVSEAPEAES